MSDTDHLDYMFHQERCATEYERQRPFTLLQPRMEQIEEKWYATYWGVVGSGTTPDTASRDFDATWNGLRKKPEDENG